MKYFCIITFLLLPFLSSAQNLPQCDSLVISCCAFDSFGNNTITIYAANPSTELFDYPGFVLMDLNLDTIAKETVNYFGIGTWPQPHTMNIVSPLNLPFDGYLDLYQLFYQQFSCRFPFSIEDTATGISSGMIEQRIKIFPNPTSEVATISIYGFPSGPFSISVVDMLGTKFQQAQFEGDRALIDLHGMSSGIYFLQVTDAENHFFGTEKLVVLNR